MQRHGRRIRHAKYALNVERIFAFFLRTLRPFFGLLWGPLFDSFEFPFDFRCPFFPRLFHRNVDAIKRYIDGAHRRGISIASNQGALHLPPAYFILFPHKMRPAQTRSASMATAATFRRRFRLRDGARRHPHAIAAAVTSQPAIAHHSARSETASTVSASLSCHLVQSPLDAHRPRHRVAADAAQDSSIGLAAHQHRGIEIPSESIVACAARSHRSRLLRD